MEKESVEEGIVFCFSLKVDLIESYAGTAVRIPTVTPCAAWISHTEELQRGAERKCTRD